MDEAELTPTPLVSAPGLAREAKVGRVFVKDESKRPFGNFKVLGGIDASLRALARDGRKSPRLICASDGNHGLAVAIAGRRAGVPVRVYLPDGASAERAVRIEAVGGEIARVCGSYDDAVDAAAGSAAAGEGILVADTSTDPCDPVVDDVMRGYRRISAELASQLSERPTHLFIQAGVGGLAAAMMEGLAEHELLPARTIIVEPEAAACVAAALRLGRPVRIDGDLETGAEMLSCGLASAPALDTLLKHDVASLVVSEAALSGAVERLRSAGGLQTSPSGAAGVAGLLSASGSDELRAQLGLDQSSRVLLIVTEGAVRRAP